MTCPAILVITIGCFIHSLTAQKLFDDSEKRPRLLIYNGNMHFRTAPGKNISFYSDSGGDIMFGDVSMQSIRATGQGLQDKLTGLQAALDSREALVSETITTQMDLKTRLDAIEQELNQLSTDRPSGAATTVPPTSGGGNNSRGGKKLAKTVRQLQADLAELKANTRDFCIPPPPTTPPPASSNWRPYRMRQWGMTARRWNNRYSHGPWSGMSNMGDNPFERRYRRSTDQSVCANGGTCISIYGRFMCLCPPQFMGPNCADDVNECTTLARTDLTCQNGGTCVNTVGSFNCVCPPNFYGFRCTATSNACAAENSHLLCGPAGTCVSVKAVGTGAPYKCICDIGWKQTNSSTNPVCEDVDECAMSSTTPCFPGVECTNTPGSFLCGQCPPGYTGSGYQCFDIDECSMNNGGCSLDPLVKCINTYGSYHCGLCPPGYVGDGTSCTNRLGCDSVPSPCHPAASCVNVPSTDAGYQCVCPSNMVGLGVGLNGCTAAAHNPCEDISCLNGGTCRGTSATTFSCVCPRGFGGNRCQRPSPCQYSPCQGGGTCVPNEDFIGFNCLCPAGRYGNLCQQQNDATCGGTFQSTTGTLKYPNSTDVYENQLNCQWTIIVPRGKIIKLNFTKFVVEIPSRHARSWCPYDNLTLYDGQVSNAPPFGVYCGTLGSGMAPDRIIFSADNAVRLVFRTDHSENREGFELLWEAIDPVCSKRIYVADGASGYVTSPNYPNSYPANSQCVTHLVAQPGKILKLEFTSVVFDSELANCSADFLQIYDGGRTGDVTLTKFCASTHVIPESFVSSMPQVTIYFHSDSVKTETGNVGFKLKYSSQNMDLVGCGGTLKTPTGVIKSPNFGRGHYYSDLNCVWVIDQSGGDISDVTIEVEIIDMDINGNAMGSYCTADYLEIYDGQDDSRPWIGKFCDKKIPPAIYSTGPTMFLKFHSDSHFGGRGFHLKYTTQCGKLLTGVNGTFQSPGFPSPPPTPMECKYVVRAPPTHEVVVVFTYFDLANPMAINCPNRYIRIEGGGPLWNRTVCVLRVPSDVVGQNEVVIYYKTDGNSAVKGFQASFTTTFIGCGGVFTGNSGTVRSPKYPQVASHNMNCRYDIEVPEDMGVRLAFQTFRFEFDAECRWDYLSIYESYTSETEFTGFKGKHCGTVLPNTITSEANKLVLIFVTDKNVATEGFVATFTAFDPQEDCSRSFLGPSGSIVSPGYPNTTVSRAVCEYSISVPNGYQILLSAVNISLPCEGNGKLSIRNGPSPHSPAIVGLREDFCGSNFPDRLRSTGNRLHITFKTGPSPYVGFGMSPRYRPPTMPPVMFRIDYEELAADCGGQLIHHSGAFQSPQYPHESSDRYDCKWTITVAAGNRVTLNIYTVDLPEGSCGMNYHPLASYVKVLDGDSIASLEKKRICQSAVGVDAITSSGTSLTVAYSQMVGSRVKPTSHKGFLAFYKTDCSNVNLMGLTGAIETPNFPSPMESDRNCEWTVKTTMGNQLVLVFTHVQIDSNADDCGDNFIEFSSPSSPAFSPRPAIEPAKFCVRENDRPVVIQKDPTSPSAFNTSLRNTELIMSGHEAKIKFRSTETYRDNKFRLEWHTRGCGQMFTAPQTFGFGVNVNDSVANSSQVECHYTISVPVGKKIQLYILQFSQGSSNPCGPYQPEYGYVEGVHVFAGLSNASGAPIRSYCGSDASETDPVLISSQSNEMFIVVRFNPRRSHTEMTGRRSYFFLANYNTTDGGCGANLTGYSGVIHSPKYPQRFQAGETCNWLITVPNGFQAVVTLNDLSVGNQMGVCRNLYQVEGSLAFYDGSSESAPVLAKHCGSSLPADPVIKATGNKMFVTFIGAMPTAMDTRVPRGFNASYSAACGATLTAGDVGQSIQMPRDLSAASVCDWTIVSPTAGGHVTLVFNLLFVRSYQAYRPMGNSSQLDNVCLGMLEVFDDNRADNGSNKFSFDQDICSGITPAPLTSTGNTMIVRMNITGYNPYYLNHYFYATYYSTASGCGGDFYSARGIFNSPGYPRTYEPNVRCEWTIHVAEGNRVQLSFEELALELSDDCQKDFIEIREKSEGGRIIKLLCGNTLPSIIESVGSMWIAFMSDEETNGRFSASYSLHFGMDFISGTSGYIESPNYVQSADRESTMSILDYSRMHINYTTPQWRIVVPQDKVVQLTFLDFNVPTMWECYHFAGALTVYDGYCNWGAAERAVRFRQSQTYGGCQAVKSLCGIDIPQPVLSSSNQISLSINTHPAMDQRGFRLKWEAIDPPETVPNGTISIPPPRGITPECSQMFEVTDDFQTLTSPGYPYGYAHMLRCRWILKAPLGFSILLNWTDVDFETLRDCRYDYILVGPMNSDVPTAENQFNADEPYLPSTERKFCIQQTAPMTLRYSQIFIMMFTDVNTNQTGFSVQYKLACGGDIVMDSGGGTISTPGYARGQQYPPSATCNWRIRFNSFRPIAVKFNFFELEESVDCVNDYVTLKNGFQSFAPQLGDQERYCGSTAPVPLKTTTNGLNVEFHSNAQRSGRGFQMTFEEIKHECGGDVRLTFSDNRTIIESPGFPNNYPASVDCIWYIIAPMGKKIQVDFDTLDLELRENCDETASSVELRDGSSRSSPMIRRLCGNTSPSSQFSTQNHMVIRFKTTATTHDTMKGFSLKASIAYCGGLVVATEGFITSPGYPLKYENNLNCNWIVQVPEGHYIRYSFLDLSIMLTRFSQNNCSDDYVEIKDTNSTGDVLGRFCSHSATDVTMISPSDRIYVNLVTNVRGNFGRGFKLQFNASAETCGGTLTDATGVIQSPRYPEPYVNRRSTCKWVISAPVGKRLTIEFNDIDLIAPDMVRISPGPEYNPFASKMFQTPGSMPFTTTSNEATVRFDTFHGGSGRGFKLTYTSDLPAVCGGEINRPQSIMAFSDMEIPNEQPLAYCHWVIRNPKANSSSIRLDFINFAFENASGSGDCIFDFVKVIGESPGFESKEERLCGTLNNFTRVFYESVVHVVFVTDHTQFGTEPFQFSVSFPDCGGVVTTTTGVITSPNYPDPHDHNTFCRWLLMAPEDQTIKITLLDLQLEQNPECRYDNLTVYNGAYRDSPKARTWCNPDVVQSTDKTFTSSSRYLSLAFMTDHSLAMRGFKIQYDMTSVDSGVKQIGTSGYFVSPGYPNLYANNINWQTEVVLPPGFYVQLNFTKFELEKSANCTKDFLQILELQQHINVERMDRWKDLGARYCGSEVPPPITTSSNHMLVQFVTDAKVQKTGFKANWTSICGGRFTDSAGVVVSPNYPSSYDNNMDCQYVIEPTETTGQNQLFVVLEFQDFQLEKKEHRCTDSLELYQANGTQKLAEMCGTDIPEPQSSKGPMRLQFKSDSSYKFRGFRANYHVSACGGNYNLTGLSDRTAMGRIKSPGFPAKYHHELDCKYLITVDSDYVVALKFSNFSMEHHDRCIYDYVEIYDGPDENSTKIGRYCGRNPPPHLIKSTDNAMLVRMVTDRSKVDGGFVASFQRTLGPNRGCGGEIIVMPAVGVLSPPLRENQMTRQPRPAKIYYPNLQCIWTLKTNYAVNGEPNEIIKLKFADFNLEISRRGQCVWDYVEVYDGVYGDSLVGKYCGTLPPWEFISSHRMVTLAFITDDSHELGGFNISYGVSESMCGGELPALAEWNFLQLDSSRVAGINNLRCRWFISANESSAQRVELAIDQFSWPTACVEFTDYNTTNLKATTVKNCGDSNFRFLSIGSVVQVTADFGATATNVTAAMTFRVKYRVLAECNRTVTLTPSNPSARLTSQGYPGTYGKRLKCTETIKAPADSRIAVYFTSFQLEDHGDCRYDYLQISDQPITEAVRKYCGTNLPPTVNSSGPNVYMYFFTDTSQESTGYDVTIVALLPARRGMKSCGGSISSVEIATITDPDHPKPFLPSIDCTWPLSLPSNKPLRLTFTKLGLVIGPTGICDGDYVTIADATDPTSATKICGTELPAPKIVSSGRAIVTFHSDSNPEGNNLGGFRLTMDAAPPELLIPA